MSVSLIERPYKYCFSKNEIRYVFQLDNLSRINLTLEVVIKYKRTTASGSPILTLTTLQLVPDADGFIYLGINKYIDSVLSYQLPNADAITTKALTQCCAFWVEFTEKSTVDVGAEYNETEFDNKRIAIKGGVAKEKFSRNNFFENLYNDAPFFLTWQPTERFVYEGQQLFLSAFFDDTSVFDTDSYKLRIEYQTKELDVSFEDFPLYAAAGAHYYHFNIKKALESITDELYLFQVSILNNADEIIIKRHNFYVQYRPLYNYYDLIWHNSLGGVDAVRIRGEVSWELDKTTEDAEGGFNVEEAMATAKSYESLFANVTYSNKFKGDIGFINTKAEQAALIELLISKSIYWFNDARWIPCLNIQKNTAVRKTTDELFSFPVEWQIAIANENYTPFETTLSIGDTTTD
jgi:hypothetical protein